MCTWNFSVMTKSIFFKELSFTWNLQWWQSLSSWRADLYLESSVMTKFIFLNSWCAPENFSDDHICLLEKLIFPGIFSDDHWPGLSSWRADFYLESSVMTKSVFFKSWFVPGIFSDDQVCLLEELIFTWNLQWWPSLSSWRVDVYLESSVMTKSVFLKSLFVPGIFSDDKVCLLTELIFTWKLQWWPSLSSWGADLFLESSVMTKSVFLKSWFIPGIFSDDQVYLLKELICTWNIQWWLSLSSWRADLYLQSSVMTKFIFLNCWCAPENLSDDQVCLLKKLIFTWNLQWWPLTRFVFLKSWFLPGIFSDDQVCLLEKLNFTWNIQWWLCLFSWRADLYLESSVMTKSVFFKSWFVPGIFSDDQICLLEEMICTWNLQWWLSLSSWRADVHLKSSGMDSIFLYS
jgi:hypothetical protein